MKKTILLFATFLISTHCAFAKHLHKERYYQDIDCKKKGGKVEYRLEDKTRVDCLTDNKAIEHDFARKWYECVGQALYYGMQTKRQPACGLIIEKSTDLEYFERAQTMITYWKLEVEIYTIEP